MLRYYYQENHPESDEIDWEMLIQDESKIDEYPEKIYRHEKPCVFEELYASDNMTHVICIVCGLLFFYGKMIIEYYLQKIDS